MSKERRKVLSALSELTKAGTPKEIAEKTGLGLKSIRGRLLGLVRGGYVTREARGVYSLTEKGKQEANRVKAAREEAMKILTVVPHEGGFHFYTDVGKYTGVTVRSLVEFSEAIRTLEFESIEFHLSRKDFERWVHDLGDHTLAENIREIRESKLSTETLKDRLYEVVKGRVKELKEAIA